MKGKQIGLLLCLCIISGIATNCLANNAYAEYAISMTRTGPQNIDIMPTTSNVDTVISQEEITVNTTCPSGYNLTISTSVADNHLYLDGNSDNTTSNRYLSPSDGNTTLSNAINTWGYYYNEDNPSTPTNDSVFAAVPTIGAATIIKTSANTSETFSVYYGIAISPTMKSGTYKMIPDENEIDGTVVYYLTMSNACLPYTIEYSPISNADDTIISGEGEMPSQLAQVDENTTLHANTFTAPTGYTFSSWNTAPDGTGIDYADEASIINLTNGNETITLYAQWALVSTESEGIVTSTDEIDETNTDQETAPNGAKPSEPLDQPKQATSDPASSEKIATSETSSTKSKAPTDQTKNATTKK